MRDEDAILRKKKITIICNQLLYLIELSFLLHTITLRIMREREHFIKLLREVMLDHREKL